MSSSKSLLALAVATVGCDPGWHYQAPSGTAVQAEGLRYDLPSTNPKIRIYASAFTGSLDVELILKNVDSQSLTLIQPVLHVDDAKGRSLPEQFPVRLTCPLSDSAMVIPGGAACTIAGVFAIQPLVAGPILHRANPDLARISVKLTSVEPKAFADLNVRMDWMK